MSSVIKDNNHKRINIFIAVISAVTFTVFYWISLKFQAITDNLITLDLLMLIEAVISIIFALVFCSRHLLGIKGKSGFLQEAIELTINYHKFSHYNFWQAFILCLIVYFSYLYFTPEKKLDFYLIASLVIGSWALILTKGVLRQQKSKLFGFKSLLKEIIDYSDHWCKSDITTEKHVCIFDYHPYIGGLSISNDSYYTAYENLLNSFANSAHIHLHIICSAENVLHKDMGVPKDTPELDKMNSELRNLDNGSRKNVCVWRTKHINPLHFIVLDDISFQYSVRPTSSGGNVKANELMGVRTEDVFSVNFLKGIFAELESRAITPEVEFWPTNKVTLTFTKQYKIKDVRFYDSNHNNDLEISNCYSNEISIEINEYLRQNKFILESLVVDKTLLDDWDEGFKIQLIKENGCHSNFSEIIKL